MNRKDNLFISAVIVAAGRGSRMNMDNNKQYIEIEGKSIIARTLQVFEDSDYIDEIILVVNNKDIVYCKQNIIDRFRFTKVRALVAGGEERQNSVFNGLREISNDCDIVLIHDGARPFLKESSIIDSVYAAYEFGAACVAVPVKDTIKAVNTDGLVRETLDRSTLWSIQTPQTFKYHLIMEAHNRALEEGFLGTDDAVLMERMGFQLKVVMGSYDNIKITTKEDLAVAEAIINSFDF